MSIFGTNFLSHLATNFSLTDTDLLLQLAAGQLDAQQLVREALAARGVDARGAWVGFTAAEKIWKTR